MNELKFPVRTYPLMPRLAWLIGGKWLHPFILVKVSNKERLTHNVLNLLKPSIGSTIKLSSEIS